MGLLVDSKRSNQMRRVRSYGNRSTEWKLRAALMRCKVNGWRMQVRNLPGSPDFVFPNLMLAVFLDGCFWHGCEKCSRTIPQTNAEYWRAKISGNKKRAVTVGRELRALGYKVVRIWEHDLRAKGAPSRNVRSLLAIGHSVASCRKNAEKGVRDREI